MATQVITEPPILDSTGQQIVSAINRIATSVKPTASDIETSAIQGVENVEDALSFLDEAIKVTDSKMVKSVNGDEPDEDGNINVDQVKFAEQIVADDAQQSSGEYVIRTTGGDASLSDGEAQLVALFGRRVHTGYQAEQLTLTVNAVERGEGETPITATIDRNTFVAYVSTSQTITLAYSSGWSASPALYGVTVTGTPVNGDEIVIGYVKEERGTITQSNPTAFKSTGWNLYNNALGYARVLKYSDNYDFLIGGTYTAVKFSATLDGEKTTITPVSGAFAIEEDGYVWVTGGNATDTYIVMTWSDWESGPEGGFKAYSESTVDLSSVMTNFPNGLMQVGNVYDEINLNMGYAYSRVERITYSSANLAYAKASGRQYEYDENYIYIAKESADTYDVSVDGAHTACDHGMEIVTGTSVPVYVQTLYGQNLVDKLRTDVVTISAQSLTTSQKTQVRTNIGAASESDSVNHAKYLNALTRHTRLTDFSLTDLQSAVADQNLAKYGLKPGDEKTIVDSSTGTAYTYVIAGLGPMKGSHAYTCTSNHVGLLVVTHKTNAWNASGKTYEGADSRGAGYLNCDLHYYLRDTVLTQVKKDLGVAHLYQHKKLLGNAINQTGYNRFGTNSGCTSGWTWSDEYISALTEAQVYGGDHWSSSGYDTGEANTLLPVFAEYKHTEIFGNEYVWLRNVSSASQACATGDSGSAGGGYGAGHACYVVGLILYH